MLALSRFVHKGLPDECSEQSCVSLRRPGTSALLCYPARGDKETRTGKTVSNNTYLMERGVVFALSLVKRKYP